mgnify:CR=1 FL=1
MHASGHLPGGEHTLMPHSLLQQSSPPGQASSFLQLGTSLSPTQTPPKLLKEAGHLPFFKTIKKYLKYSNLLITNTAKRLS